MAKLSHIEKLIQDLCPTGVEYKALGEIAKRNKGMNITAGQMKDIANPQGDVRIFAAGNTKVDVLESDIPQAKVIREPGIIVKSRGHVSFEYYNKPFTHKNEMWSYTNCVNANIKYIYYYLSQHTAYFQATAKANAVKLPQLCVADTDSYKIPLPPIQIQDEIVRIIDTFANLIENIDTEIGEREKQMSLTKEFLLQNVQDKGEWKTIGELCDIKVGGEPPKNVTAKKDSNHRYPIYGNGRDVYGYTDTYQIDVDAVAISSIGANTGAVFYHKAGFTPIIRLKVLLPKTKAIDSRYLFYACSLIDFNSKKSSVPNMSAADVKAKKIVVPPIAEQRAIAEKLDTIEAFINNLKTERDLRQQQYEYYREHLINLLK